MSVPDYLAVNRANWDARVPHHVRGYGLERFDDPGHLSETVRFDVPRLGDIAGRETVHLQCHIGTDTLSLHRLGARVTGVDFSAPALEVARTLAARIGAEARFVESDVYGAPAVLARAAFDLVYTGIGALCWLPDIERWATVVATLLRTGGELFIREGHPMLWTLGDPRPDGLVTVAYPYFETDGDVFTETQSYVDHDGEIASPTFVSFNHGLGEVFNALWSAGLEIISFEEHDSVPWNPLGDAMVEGELGEWRLRERPERLAATYTLRAVKR
jgi:SAM-dependent methyltransferase